MKIVIIRHPGDNGRYLFEVPSYGSLAKGDFVLVRNKNGLTVGECMCNNFEVDETVFEELRLKFGAAKELRRVVGIMARELWEVENES